MSVNIDDLNEEYLSVSAEKPTNGRYYAILRDARMVCWKSDTRQVIWELEVRDLRTGNSTGITKYHTLERGLIRYLHQDLKRLGIVLGTLGELHQELNGLIGATIEIDFAQGDPWDEVYFIRLVSRA